jgi:hypothetical protein
MYQSEENAYGERKFIVLDSLGCLFIDVHKGACESEQRLRQWDGKDLKTNLKRVSGDKEI